MLVTGAAGFVGAELVRRLRAEGARVHGITRAVCDLTDPVAIQSAVARASPDFMFHLAAARATSDARERAASATVNTFSGRWLVEALPDSCRVVVQLGSSTEYASSREPIDEAVPLHPRGFFGVTKAAGSLMLVAAAAERGISSRVLRAFQIYGPEDHAHRFVPTVLAAARTGDVVPLTTTGLRRDWVWVGDVVDACVRAAAAEVGANAVYNIGTGVQTANEELVALAEDVTGRRIATRPGALISREWDTEDWVCDPSAARRDLGWQASVDLRAGLRICWAAA